ncbi:hypothetical protein N7532_001896 [Penicillium argentinense]|uniref:Uncharacterized protein n=1 Tax=Penicillium argentinense TaxID=1131581 RepID=A0A9W9KMV8_9EURO|nr:uncharacterized protein N7532_001896 [Penicillium argentinense]KAJ5111361.1 hypothetical protein N7532_001896 [Penicillium argentinense]
MYPSNPPPQPLPSSVRKPHSDSQILRLNIMPMIAVPITEVKTEIDILRDKRGKALNAMQHPLENPLHTRKMRPKLLTQLTTLILQRQRLAREVKLDR